MTERQESLPATTTAAPVTPPRPEKKATLRLGQRELSLISLAVILLITGALVFGGYRLFVSFRSQRNIVMAQSNLVALYKAMRGYAQDWDYRLPPADTWTDAVQGYLPSPPGMPGGKEAYLHGPSDLGEVGYVYNDLAAGYNLERPELQKSASPNRLVLLIEKPGAGRNAHAVIPPQGNAQGEAALAKMLSFPHYADDAERATTLILYADGHIERPIRRDLAQR